MNDDEPTLTTKEAAELLRRSMKRIRQLVASGRLRQGEHFVRPGGNGHYLWRRDALIRYRDEGECRKEPTDEPPTIRFFGKEYVADGR